ncbi:unnamed protein product [Acanthoscelides obtectus]|uniref:Uncharacterized protein n=1 Tax=Acanthoscelides obtectus TaxID=200917 RepID=A0A9P0MMD0_ACAOB|nr:unnamed protein product [Acanthoscelides obtectus]CAK1622435.1 hypothetical protein AOBTE_LOCUS1479 [Acanthoscelides obtectus]
MCKEIIVLSTDVETQTTIYFVGYTLSLPYKLGIDSKPGPSKRVKYGDADFEASLLKRAEEVNSGGSDI